MVEYWDAYDKNRNKLKDRVLERSAFPVGRETYHLAVNVWVQDGAGNWLFMKRAKNKPHYSQYYEAGAGGSVLKGESSEQAAKRELVEETGLVADQLDFLFSFTEDRYLTHFDTYLARVAGIKHAVRYQEDETEAHVWLAPAEIPHFLENHLVFQNQKEQILNYL